MLNGDRGPLPARAATPGVSVDDLRVEHHTDGGPVIALDGVSFTLDAGSSVAIMGPSGGGKSTLLAVVGGLTPPTSGTVRIGGADMSTMSEGQRSDFRRRHVGFVYQSDNLLPFLTVAENVELSLALDHRPADPGRSRDLLSTLGLAEETDRLPDQLSGGQRQRAAVARAVVHRPTLLLADEPTGALDPDNATAVLDLLLDASGQIGATLLMVTHDEEAASRLDRRIGLADGRLT